VKVEDGEGSGCKQMRGGLRRRCRQKKRQGLLSSVRTQDKANVCSREEKNISTENSESLGEDQIENAEETKNPKKGTNMTPLWG